MKKITTLLLTLFCACGLFIGNVGAASSEVALASAEAQATETANTDASGKIDYAGQAVLDLDADSKTLEATVKIFIDGDTTHFHVDGWNSENLYKARYAAVNTPESTGQLEPWGKKAANFTRSRLETATSIIIESDGTEFEPDSTGDRYLSWIWYKAPGSDVYRNLNLELLQEGLAVGSKATESRYGELATQAIAQATALKLHVFSQEKDPDFYYGESIEIDLKELRLNVEQYELKRVAFEATVAYYEDHSVYVEDYDEETQMYYGIYIFYGYNMSSKALQYLQPGNRLRITGKVTYYETGDNYQVSDLKYNAYKPSDDDLRLIEKNQSAANVETTAEKFTSTVPVEANYITGWNDDGTTNTVTETRNQKYANLVLNTSISMKGLLVKSAYTTANGGDNDGAMTLTCESGGKTIKVRTGVFRHPTTGELLTEDQLIGKTIDVAGVVDYFSGDYQIKVLKHTDLLVNGEAVFKPVEQPTPPATTPTDTPEEESGCGGIVATSALLPLAAVAVLIVKKRKH